MNREDIIHMAREAGWTGIYSQWIGPTEREDLTVPVTMEQIERFAKLVYEKAWADTALAATHTITDAAIALEREACAKRVEVFDKAFNTGGVIAHAIRARGEK